MVMQSLMMHDVSNLLVIHMRHDSANANECVVVCTNSPEVMFDV